MIRKLLNWIFRKQYEEGLAMGISLGKKMPRRRKK